MTNQITIKGRAFTVTQTDTDVLSPPKYRLTGPNGIEYTAIYGAWGYLVIKTQTRSRRRPHSRCIGGRRVTSYPFGIGFLVPAEDLERAARGAN